MHELGANGKIRQPRPDIEGRYAVVPTVFAVLDKHTGQPVQLYHGADAEVRAEEHARHLRARTDRLRDQNIGERGLNCGTG